MDWKKNCNNCEHACVCGNPDGEAFNVCEHWSGWIPSEVELPKEEKEYMIIEYGKYITLASYSFDLSKVSKLEFGEEHSASFYYWSSSYHGWVDSKPKYWRPVIDKPEV